MFEISFGELAIIGLVALIVLGPERLPAVARTMGALVGRAQRFIRSVKSDIHQHSQMAGFNDLKQDVEDAANVFRGQIEKETAEVRQLSYDIEQETREAGQLLEEAGSSVTATVQHTAATTVSVDNENQLDLFSAPSVSGEQNQMKVNARE